MDVVSSFDLADGGSRHVIHSIRSDSDSVRILWLRLISGRSYLLVMQLSRLACMKVLSAPMAETSNHLVPCLDFRSNETCHLNARNSAIYPLRYTQGYQTQSGLKLWGGVSLKLDRCLGSLMTCLVVV